MSKGTIVYIGGMEMPNGNAAAHRVRSNSKIFKTLGYDVVFVGVDKTLKEDLYEPRSFDGFLSFPAKYPENAREWIKSLYGFKHVKFVLDKFPDLKFAVCYNMHAKPLERVLKYCKKRGVKVIADSTEWYENKFSLSPIKFIKWLDTKKSMTVLQKKVDGMIAISKYLYEYYKNSVKNIIQLPPLVDVKESVWQAETSESERVEFVYAGQPGKDKDKLDLIVSAFNKIGKGYDFHFNVIGVTKEEFLSDYPNKKREVEELGEKVVFFGRVSHEESVKALIKGDYCVFIREKSRKNAAGFPTKFAECVTSGIGIIANDVSNIRDYFPLKNSCLLQNADEDSIASALKDAAERGKIKHEISETFDYGNYIRDMESLLGE